MPLEPVPSKTREGIHRKRKAVNAHEIDGGDCMGVVKRTHKMAVLEQLLRKGVRKILPHVMSDMLNKSWQNTPLGWVDRRQIYRDTKSMSKHD